LQEYADRLVRLIPAEVIALYTAVRGFFEIPKESPGAAQQAASSIATSPDSTQIQLFLDWWPFICLLLVIFVRAWGTRSDMTNWRTVQWLAVFVAAVSFFLWVNVTGARFFGWQGLVQPLWAALGATWVFLVPYFYKG